MLGTNSSVDVETAIEGSSRLTKVGYAVGLLIAGLLLGFAAGDRTVDCPVCPDAQEAAQPAPGDVEAPAAGEVQAPVTESTGEAVAPSSEAVTSGTAVATGPDVQ